MSHKLVAVNIITGFLGVGKTTAILNLLHEKPSNEKWIVIVNEIGRVAIDNNILSNSNIEGVEINEISGGCLCCSASDNFHQSLVVALNQLKPDRIIIEPSGLGHISVLHQSFQDESVKNQIDIRSTICLVDANDINQVKIQNNEVYREQLKEADIVLINKNDITDSNIIQNFKYWLTENIGPKQFINTTQNGIIAPELLQLENTKKLTDFTSNTFTHYIEKSTIQLNINTIHQQSTPETPVLLANKVDGFNAFGLLFHPENCFVKYKLQLVLSTVDALRIKGIFKTTTGWFLFNRINHHFSVLPASQNSDSRVEIIYFDEKKLDTEKIQKEIMLCLE